MSDSVFAATVAQRVYLVEMSPYDPATGAQTALRFATRAFTTQPGDTPANAWFEPCVQSPPIFSRSLARDGALSGRSFPDMGVITFANASGLLDGWGNLNFDGRDVTVKLGLEGAAYTDFQVVFSGLMAEPSITRLGVSLPVTDRQGALDKPLQATLFAGTGGMEGGADLKGKPKPVCLGEVKNIVPIPVDTTARIYQCHDGAINAITAVYDNGKLLATPANYTVDLAAGTFTLTAAPGGLITADVQGDATGGVFAASVGDVLRRIAVKYGGLADPGDLDTAAFTALAVKTTATIGFYTGAADANVLNVLDDVTSSVGAFYGFNRAGLFTVGRIGAPTGTPSLTFDANDMLPGLTRDYQPVRWRVRVGYQRAWAVQSPDTLDAAATQAFKDFVAQEWRTAEASNADIKTDGIGKGGHKNAIDPDQINTFLAVLADATTEAQRLLGVYGERRSLVKFMAKTKPFQLDVGAEILVSHPRFGLAAGKAMIVIGLNERPMMNEIDVTAWG